MANETTAVNHKLDFGLAFTFALHFERITMPSKFAFPLIAELRRPEGPPSGAHKQHIYGKRKETHELIFSWLSWLAVLLVGAYARR